MCSSVGDRTCLLPGFPIRKSSDQSSVDSSPRLIAASYVLHRLLVPRHPPCALNNLATKMLASTVQFSNNGRSRPTTVAYTHKPGCRPTKKRSNRTNRPDHPATNTGADGPESPEEAVAPSGPNSVPKPTLTTTHRSNPTRRKSRTGLGDNKRRPNGQCSTP